MHKFKIRAITFQLEPLVISATLRKRYNDIMVTHGVTIASTTNISVVVVVFFVMSELDRPSVDHHLHRCHYKLIYTALLYWFTISVGCVRCTYMQIHKKCILKWPKCTKCWKIVVHNKIADLCACAHSLHLVTVAPGSSI